MKPSIQLSFWRIGLLFLLSPIVTFAQSSPTYSVFLIGDAGEPNLNNNNLVLNTLRIQMNEIGKNSSVIFLGDNIYPKGLVRINESGRKEAEQALIQQLNILKNYEGKPFIIPGNHDWQQGGKSGWEYVKNQGKFVAEYLQNQEVFFPKGGCPTPHEVSLNQDISLVLLDTQWWLHAWDKPELHSDCEVKTLEDMLGMVNDILERNQHKKVLVLGHHPMYSHGSHGGYFTTKDHLTPFHELGIPIPLPILGSIYPLYRSLIGDIQDIPHPKYRQMRNGLVKLFKQYPNVLYASGHEHNLQLIVRDSINYIVSGAGSKRTPVKVGRDSKFAKSTKGFARLDFYDNKIVLTFWEGDGQQGKELFSTDLKFPNKNLQSKTNYTQKIASEGIIPNPKYRASSFKKWLLGNNYRDVWTTPIQTNFLNFQTQENGLKVIQKGGGFQTLSLRYANKEGLQFVTRSIEKYPSKAIPESIRSDFTEDIVTDQISASHPYAALVVAQLAKSAGILHTNPQLIIIPDDTCLHNYKRLFANQLALFEERPDGGFAGSKKIQSTQKLLEKLAEDSNNSVDEQAIIKARIFDMWIGDWDRHDDQWRWAGYETERGFIYKPIPRDRDQAFFVNEGLLPKIVSRKWILPKLQGFDYEIRDVPGLAFNARYFDRSFIPQSSHQDWIENAKNLQHNMTDEVIDEAVSHFPNLSEYSKIIAEKLKTRRNDLVGYTEQLYNFLSRNVDVLGSNKDEIFKVKRLSGGETEVSVFAKKKNNEEGKRIYHRVFDPAITKEIRLYGLDGEDNFVVSGLAKKGIKVRLIGGEGKDSFTDSSNVKGCQKKTVVYDKIEDSSLEIGTETANKLSTKNEVNEYNREAFSYDKLTPLASFAYNPDDGIFIGTGIQWTKQGFRKKPFESQQGISGNVAFGTGSYNVLYKGEFTDILGKIDFVLKATIQQGGLVDNFFGLSNESKYDQEKGIDFYRIRFENQSFQGLFKNQFGNLTIFSGVAIDTWEIKENPTKFINEFSINNPEIFNRKTYLGIKSGFTFDNRNNTIFPTHGILWNLEANFQKGLHSSENNDFINLKTDISFYYSFKLPAMVSLASRFGGGINFTDFELFQSNSLGGLSNLRGFRRTRFSGKSSFYNNTEMRVKVINVKSYLFPAYLGVLAFHDVGRVWNPDEKSELWHQGYGLGLWFTPFNLFVVSTTYGKSNEDNILTVKAGMFF